MKCLFSVIHIIFFCSLFAHESDRSIYLAQHFISIVFIFLSRIFTSPSRLRFEFSLFSRTSLTFLNIWYCVIAFGANINIKRNWKIMILKYATVQIDWSFVVGFPLILTHFYWMARVLVFAHVCICLLGVRTLCIYVCIIHVGSVSQWKIHKRNQIKCKT